VVHDEGQKRPQGARLSSSRRWTLAASLYAYAVSVGASSFLIVTSRKAADIDPRAGEVLLWQALNYGLWIPAALVTCRVLVSKTPHKRLLIVLGALGVAAIIVHAGAAAALELRFSAAAPGSLATVIPDRLPIDILVYTAICAALWAAAAQERSRDLDAALARARRANIKQTSHPDIVLAASGTAQIPVKVSSIEWIGAAGNYVVINWEGREALVRETLKSFETRLDEAVFARIHRSTIVNLGKVAKAWSLSDGSWRLEMQSGAPLIASRTYRDRILARLGKNAD
jgi:DNA-binding LytR/AlgR family response regulator